MGWGIQDALPLVPPIGSPFPQHWPDAGGGTAPCVHRMAHVHRSLSKDGPSAAIHWPASAGSPIAGRCSQRLRGTTGLCTGQPVNGGPCQKMGLCAYLLTGISPVIHRPVSAESGRSPLPLVTVSCADLPVSSQKCAWLACAGGAASLQCQPGAEERESPLHAPTRH